MCEIRVRHYRRQFLRALKTACDKVHSRQGWLLRCEDSNGVRWAEVAPFPGWSEESAEDVEQLLRRVAAGEVSALAQLPCTAWAAWQLGLEIEEALAPAPSAQLIGTVRDLPVAETTDTCKVKIAVYPPEEEIPQLRSWLSRNANARLRVDANGGLDPSQLAGWLQFLASEPQVEYLEQPLPRGQEKLLWNEAGELTRRLALDESVMRPADLQQWVEAGWPGYWIVKPSLFGNPSALLSLNSSQRQRIVLSSVFETPVGLCGLQALSHLLGPDRPVEGFGTEIFFGDDQFQRIAGESWTKAIQRCWCQAEDL